MLVENLRARNAGRAGASDDEDLQRLNPNLVLVRISRFGQDGPLP